LNGALLGLRLRLRAEPPQGGRRARNSARPRGLGGALRLWLSRAVASRSRCQGGFSIRRRGSLCVGRRAAVRVAACESSAAVVADVSPVSPAPRSALHVAEGARAVWWLPIARRLLPAGRCLRPLLLPEHFRPSFNGPGSALGLRLRRRCRPDAVHWRWLNSHLLRAWSFRDVTHRPTRRCSRRSRGLRSRDRS
jgi:hypothetical protein